MRPLLPHMLRREPGLRKLCLISTRALVSALTLVPASARSEYGLSEIEPEGCHHESLPAGREPRQPAVETSIPSSTSTSRRSPFKSFELQGAMPSLFLITIPALPTSQTRANRVRLSSTLQKRRGCEVLIPRPPLGRPSAKSESPKELYPSPLAPCENSGMVSPWGRLTLSCPGSHRPSPNTAPTPRSAKRQRFRRASCGLRRTAAAASAVFASPGQAHSSRATTCLRNTPPIECPPHSSSSRAVAAAAAPAVECRRQEEENRGDTNKTTRSPNQLPTSSGSLI